MSPVFNVCVHQASKTDMLFAMNMQSIQQSLAEAKCSSHCGLETVVLANRCLQLVIHRLLVIDRVSSTVKARKYPNWLLSLSIKTVDASADSI